uniref:Uncharacterized protein n=1 Tax=Timema poppense TaxID=170557 RepID=A0A7R9DIW0_TIMPO|nr:unnamed protein product [Timema poppensis]
MQNVRPHVETSTLKEYSDVMDLNIAEELVKRGFAVWEEAKDQILTSPHKDPSTHSSRDTSSLELNGHSKTRVTE